MLREKKESECEYEKKRNPEFSDFFCGLSSLTKTEQSFRLIDKTDKHRNTLHFRLFKLIIAILAMKEINLVINGIKIKSLSFKYVEFSIKLLIRNNCR